MTVTRYILGSHNSWSYLPVRQWWLRPFAFMARCQSVGIAQQYERYGVRCFDLRIREKNGEIVVAHGLAEYDITYRQLLDDLEYLDSKGDCYVRVIHEVRTKKEHDQSATNGFYAFCNIISYNYKNIRFWGGRNLYDWGVDYYFVWVLSCEEAYSSVKKPRLLDDWFPWLYARLHNKKLRERGTDKNVLLIDFVDIS